MTQQAMMAFTETVWEYYRAHGRHDLPWRQLNEQGAIDPYVVLVSELMLQQTQVPRVIPKFQEFTTAFSSFEVLAAAPLSAVLQAWLGLGYNRRAKFLWQTAQIVMRDHTGQLPRTHAALVALPGIGPNTAGAIQAYAYNMPVSFLETNIRTVFIHHFFAGQPMVHDRELLPLVQQAVPEHETRDWYWALMDYGTHLKQTVGNLSRASATYAKQSAFEGSRRQLRGQVLRLLASEASCALPLLQETISDERLVGVLADLATEGLIVAEGEAYQLATTGMVQ